MSQLKASFDIIDISTYFTSQFKLAWDMLFVCYGRVTKGALPTSPTKSGINLLHARIVPKF